MKQYATPFLNRLAERWAGQYPPDGRPNHVVRWEDDMALCVRSVAMELRAGGHEIASDFVSGLLSRYADEERDDG